ncbi:hypothetical protein vseg_004453 [Gypsophila vaccaria]
MNTESVVEFLGSVVLLQRLPSSSVRKIAKAVEVKHFDEGEHVIRNGEGEGIYFVLEGKAEVCGYLEEDNCSEITLKCYDYFGNGVPTSEQQADVIALSKLTCLMLPSEHCCLLQPKSIWNKDDIHGICAQVESILHLDQIKVNLYQGITLPYAPMFGNVFGGQFMGHALAAASKTVHHLKLLHHFQAYFLLAGEHDIPITYEVHPLNDGKSFASRRVDAIQKGNVVFMLLASFQKKEKGFEYQKTVMPLVPDPDTLLSYEELREKRMVDPRLSRTYRNKLARTKLDGWPIDIRFCDLNISTSQTKSPASLSFWFKPRGKLSDDQALHRCVVAYASDFMFIEVSSNPHRQRGLKIRPLSLNHTMWFHRPVNADDWLLFVIESPSSSEARGVVSGQMFNKNGELIATLAQEGLIRAARTPQTSLRAKY